MDTKARNAIIQLARATLQLARSISILSSTVQNKELKDELDKHFTAYLKALDEAMDTVVQEQPK